MISLLAAAAALSPKLVSFHDFALGCRWRLCLPSLSPFMISLLAAAAALSPNLVSFMISLLAAAAALSPKLVSLNDFALGCRCRLVFQACLPSCFCSWLPLPPCLPSLSPFMISLLAAAAALSHKLVSLHDFALGGRWRLCLPSLSPFMILLLAAAAALSPKLVSFMISLLAAAAALSPSLSPFVNPQIAGSYGGFYVSMAGFLIAEIGLSHVSQACLPSWFCSWMSVSFCMISLPRLLLAAACRLDPQAYKSSWLSFSVVISLFCFGLLLTAALSSSLFLFVLSHHSL